MQFTLILDRKHAAGSFPEPLLRHIPISSPCSSFSAVPLFRMIDAGDSFQLLRRDLPSPAKYRAVYEVGKNIFLLHKGTESVVFLSHVPSSFFFSEL